MDAVLAAHPAFPSLAVDRIGVTVERASATLLRLRYVVHGRVSDLLLPSVRKSARTDGLWQHTCFEAFVGAEAGYCEFNLSPSTQWAAYRFDSYRRGMRDADIAPPNIETRIAPSRFDLSAELALPGEGAIGLCAVIEEKDGTKSYWALAHAPGPPDFHHPDCFALELPAAPAP